MQHVTYSFTGTDLRAENVKAVRLALASGKVRNSKVNLQPFNAFWVSMSAQAKAGKGQVDTPLGVPLGVPGTENAKATEGAGAVEDIRPSGVPSVWKGADSAPKRSWKVPSTAPFKAHGLMSAEGTLYITHHYDSSCTYEGRLICSWPP